MQASSAPRVRPGYTRLQRIIEVSGITLFFALTPVTLLKLYTVGATPNLPAAWIVVTAIVTALLAADLISGIVHWAADNWGSPDWPLLGPGFIVPFRHHHAEPEEMTHHDFVEMNGNNCIISLPTYWVGNWSMTEMTPAYGMFWGMFWFALAYWVLATNQIHAWAHTKNPPRLVRWLQTARLILAPGHHAVHHAAPHNRNYCITTGWLNLPLQWLRIFQIIDWTLSKVTGGRPDHHRVSEALRSGDYSSAPSSLSRS